MPLPPKEMYTIAEVAGRWKVPVKAIEDYLLTGRLQSSVFLPRKMMYKYTLQTNVDYDGYFDCAAYIYDIDHHDPESFLPRQGVFNICYQDIEWDEHGQATLKKGELYLTLPDEEDCYFGYDEAFVLSQDDVVVTLSELNRFEAEHGITSDLEANIPEKITASFPAIDYKLHPKERESLLKIIIAMAMDGYGYNPADKKSPIPAEIVAHVEELGLSIDVDTVRKWLREAAALLPGE